MKNNIPKKLFLIKITTSFFAIFLFSFIINSIHAQENNIDSLKTILKNNNLNDSLRLDVLSNLCWEFVTSDATRIDEYLNTLKALETKIYGINGFYKTKIVLGYYYKSIGEFDLSHKYFFDALLIHEKKNDTLNIIRSLYRLGELRNNTHNISRPSITGYNYFKRGLELLKVYKNPEQLIFFQNGMALALTNEGHYKRSLEFLDKSKVIYDTIDFPGKKRSLGFFHYSYGRNYYYMKQFDAAIYEINLARKIASDLQQNDLLIETNYYLGELNFEMKNFIKAEQYFLQNITLQKERGISWEAEAYKQILDFYLRTKNSSEAFKLIGYYLKLQDSLINKMKKDKYAEFEVRYNLREKEFENKLLEKKNLSQNHRLKLFQIMGILLVIIIIGFLYFLLKLKHYADTLSISNAYKDQILNVMGHDIRTPLLSQMMLTQDLMSEMPSKAEIQQLYNISLSVFKISDNVYNWAKMASNSTHNDLKSCHLYNELLLVLDQYEPIMKTKNLDINFHPQYINLFVVGDRIGIQAIIRNLVDNCVKYSPSNGNINIVITSDQDWVYFETQNKTLKPGEQTFGLQGNKGMGINIIKEILNYNHGDLKFAGYQDDMFKTIVQFKLSKTNS